MTLILIFGLGVVVGILVWLVVKKKRSKIGGMEAYHSERQENKEEGKRKIVELLRERDSITNNDVEKLLGVSDATATRYLEELEKEGRIEQVGREGRSVHYKLT